MSDIRKAAVLLMSLDRPVASEVMSEMDANTLEAVTMEIARVKDVTREEQENVLNEFHGIVAERTQIESGGLDFADQLLRQSLGDEQADQILESVRQSMNSLPFGFLHKASPDNVLTFISEEHPQTIALIMSHLPIPLAAEVLSGLKPEKQLEVVRRIAAMEQTSPDVVRDVQGSLEGRMRSMINQRLEAAGGVPMVAQILNVTDRVTNKGILESLEDTDDELVEEIKRRMFVFDDMLKLDDRAIQAILKEVENKQWAVALKGASEEIKQKIMGNLSQRAGEMLREEMEFLGPVRVSDVEGVQGEIVETIRRLEDAGEIQISSGGQADEFVA